MVNNKELLERFLRYVKIDTQSKEDETVQPSTAKQKDLARILFAELKDLSADPFFDEEYGYVYASLPGSEPALGFVAHMDTAPAASGTGVNPRIVENYDGGKIILNNHSEAGTSPVILDPDYFPELHSHIGEDLIVTDGTTLLGADDKAGVAEIMNLFEFYANHPEIPHRRLCLAFTPDEEVGRGTEHFDTDRFGAKEAYTVDGGKMGEIEYECFNAASAVIKISGTSVHPGDAKNKMVNAAALAVECHSMLPQAETPEHTEGYEGFYMLGEINGSCEEAYLKYIIRDHDREKFEKRKAFMQTITDYMNRKYGEYFTLTLNDQYYNMADLMKDHLHLIENAKKALKELGVNASVIPIRGGTDGAKLTYMGVPCPNLCTGGYNFHGRYEYASVQEMEICAEMLIKLAQ
ncbi:MAG: peptidase T [Lachnospiraceae bacterium]|nr:peptidase T [Lachnospiraceae bacterium]